jgi:hypothetical protein
MKPIRLSGHAVSKLALRGGAQEEVIEAIREAKWEGAKENRLQCRKSFPYGKLWNAKAYNTKQVKAIFEERENEIFVNTVYVFYF